MITTAASTSTELAEEIRRVRGGRTQRIAAVAFECTEKTLRLWETGRSRPTERRHLRALAREGVSLALLLADDDESSIGE